VLMNRTSLVQLDTGSGQNDDMRGDELLAFGAVVNGGLRPDSKFTLDFGVGVDDELEFVGILAAIERKRKLRGIDVGNCPRN
jgi:hypothetical protein